MTECKPTQIAAIASTTDGVTDEIVYALCDDGSIWMASQLNGYVWGRLPKINGDQYDDAD